MIIIRMKYLAVCFISVIPYFKTLMFRFGTKNLADRSFTEIE